MGNGFPKSEIKAQVFDLTHQRDAKALLANAATLMEAQFKVVQRTICCLPEKTLELVDITNRMLQLTTELKELSQPEWVKELQAASKGRG